MLSWEEIVLCRIKLQEYYHKHRKLLPWRGDPIHIHHIDRNIDSITDNIDRNSNIYSKDDIVIIDNDDDNIAIAIDSDHTVSIDNDRIDDTTSLDHKKETMIKYEITPYHILVSEAMCQQTRIATVIPYWMRWIKSYPTIADLAQATEEQVNASWAGLGYYRRAQNLRKTAIAVMERFNGEIPRDEASLLSLPGIGPYTSGAVRSIAFNDCAAVVDGNVIRVLSRLRALPYAIGSKLMDKTCWSLANALVDPVTPGIFNQSLMEFGSQVCRPVNPLCDECGVRSICKARMMVDEDFDSSVDIEDLLNYKREHNVDSVSHFPVKAMKVQPRQVTCIVLVLRMIDTFDESSEPKYLFVRRPSTGLLANQWEFPCIELRPEKQVEAKADDDLDAKDIIDLSGTEKDATSPKSKRSKKRKLTTFETTASNEDTSIHYNLSRALSRLCNTRGFQIDLCSFPDRTTIPMNCFTKYDHLEHVFSHEVHTMRVYQLLGIQANDLKDGSVQFVASGSSPQGLKLPPLTIDSFFAKSKSSASKSLKSEQDVGSKCVFESVVSNMNPLLAPGYDEFRWLTAEAIQEIGITSGCKKILKMVSGSKSTSAVKQKQDEGVTVKKAKAGRK